jgi:polar amino acid transport system substrate-binding protein
MFLMLAGTAVAKKIVFASDSTWPPMEYVDETKQITGYSIELMRAVAKEAGFEAEFKSVAWDGIFAGLANKSYDAICSSVEMTPERKKAMDFTQPYYKVTQALVVAKGAPYKSIEDMKGKIVGAQISTTGHMAVKKVKGVQDKSYDEIGLAFEDLVNGRIEGVVTDDPVAAYFAIKRPEYAGKMQILGNVKTAQTGEYAIAVRKGDKDTQALINKGLEAVKAKGIDKQLQDKFIGAVK